MNELMDARFYEQIRSILETARNQAYSAANSAMVQAYWSIGKSIVEQQGKSERAEYGRQLLQELSKQLTHDFGKGFTASNLRNMRQFYLTFSNCYALRSNLSWTHYRMLMRVENEKARNFYLEECEKANWSTRQLERQINSFFYERLLSSRDKEAVGKEIHSLEPAKKPEDVIHDPYVLEFLGMKQSADFYEKDLESALIGELQNFLLELGRGFSFVARQKHINLDGEHFYIDLVFYNYILKCFVLIDLKTGKLTHQDIGQMDSYIRIFDELQKGEDDNPTIGIILCSEKNEAIAKYSVLNDGKQLFASKYQLTLPTAEELERYIENERRKYEEREDIL
jgi:predicted nuclease of restriction endonuclease-like (RecB) superfamily